jgi:predicted nuclease of predicted toxin-antitoxin system
MKIFIDQCVHADAVQALRKEGFIVETAFEAGLHKADDQEIFKHAKKTKQGLLTFDHDFGNIIRFPVRGSAGTVIFYFEKMSKKAVIAGILNFFTSTNGSKLRNRLCIVEPNVKRFWP